MNRFWRKLGFNKTLSKKSRYDKNPEWNAKRLELSDVAEKVPNGSNITIGSTSATAHATLSAIVYVFVQRSHRAQIAAGGGGYSLCFEINLRAAAPILSHFVNAVLAFMI